MPAKLDTTMFECLHDWPDHQNFCTHLGHKTLGSHSRHYVCNKCGALKSVSLSTKEITIMSANEAMQCIWLWNPIINKHRCVTGWCGVIVADMPSNFILVENGFDADCY